MTWRILPVALPVRRFERQQKILKMVAWWKASSPKNRLEIEWDAPDKNLAHLSVTPGASLEQSCYLHPQSINSTSSVALKEREDIRNQSFDGDPYVVF